MMFDGPLFANVNDMFFYFPLALVISLVYSASRYESTVVILRRASRMFVAITLFMGIVLSLLVVLST